MKTLLRVRTLALWAASIPIQVLCISPALASSADVKRMQIEAQDTTIVRDDWGIAHVHGRTDADAVFGMIYAQAEDDFNRIETNYLTSLGRLAEAEGESALWQDLRQRLFIDPEVHPRVLAHFEPWMALSFSEGSIGGDIERVSLPELQAFYDQPIAVVPA